MASAVQKIATITSKGQTTVPEAVRQALGVSAGDRIAFVLENGMVSVRRAEVEDIDPAMNNFLGFLARDIESRPEVIRDLTPEFRDRLHLLTQGVRINLNEEIDGDVAL